MTKYLRCKKCKDECQVDGEFPDFIVYCETCNDYATYNDEDLISDYAAEAEYLNDLLYNE